MNIELNSVEPSAHALRLRPLHATRRCARCFVGSVEDWPGRRVTNSNGLGAVDDKRRVTSVRWGHRSRGVCRPCSVGLPGAILHTTYIHVQVQVQVTPGKAEIVRGAAWPWGAGPAVRGGGRRFSQLSLLSR